MRHKFDVEVREGNGAIVSDQPGSALHDLIGHEGEDSSCKFYGGRYFLCESVSGAAAERIVLLWNRCRALSNDDLRKWSGPE
jgi:hypothetical protein